MSVEIDLTCTQDINDLIADLREAKRKTRRNAGEYHVRRESKIGKVIFNISIPHNECLE